jgi:hypothetical protein
MTVLSSTSNSKIEVLRGNWLRTWAIALSLLFVLLFLWEGAWRARGFVPMMADSPALWANVRRQVKPDSVVIIGSSRSAVGIDPRLYEQLTGKKTLQLSITAASPLPVLKHFAADESFKGTIICELVENAILIGYDEPRSQMYINESKNESLVRLLEFRADSFLQQHLVSAMPELNPYQVLKSVFSGELPHPPHVYMYPDRTRLSDFSKVDVQKVIANGLKGVTNLGQGRFSKTLFMEMAAKMEEDVRRIQSRGGRVVFVRMPTSGVQWSHTEVVAPKVEFWDAFAAQTSAITIHFKDYPELADIDCPDYSHIDKRDVPRFTTALAKIIEAKTAP